MSAENPREWITVEADEEAAIALAGKLSTPLPVARLLVSRGFINVDQAWFTARANCLSEKMQSGPFVTSLCIDVLMLQRAAAAHAKRFTQRRHAVRAGAMHRKRTCKLKATFLLDHLRGDALANECTVNENGLAIIAGNATPIMGHIRNFDVIDLTSEFLFSSHSIP